MTAFLLLLLFRCCCCFAVVVVIVVVVVVVFVLEIVNYLSAWVVVIVVVVAAFAFLIFVRAAVLVVSGIVSVCLFVIVVVIVCIGVGGLGILLILLNKSCIRFLKSRRPHAPRCGINQIRVQVFRRFRQSFSKLWTDGLPCIYYRFYSFLLVVDVEISHGVNNLKSFAGLRLQCVGLDWIGLDWVGLCVWGGGRRKKQLIRPVFRHWW